MLEADIIVRQKLAESANRDPNERGEHGTHVRKKYIAAAKKMVFEVDQGPDNLSVRTQVLTLLSNANIYSVNTRYIKSMDWIDYSNSRVSNLDGYYIDTELFVTTDIPCHFKSAWFTLMFYNHKVTNIVDLYTKLWNLLVTENTRRGYQYNYYSRDQFTIDHDIRKTLEQSTMILTTISQRRGLLDVFYDDCEKYGTPLVLREEDGIKNSVFLDHTFNRDAFYLKNRQNNVDAENRLINLEMMLKFTFDQSLALHINPEVNQHITSNEYAVSLSDFHDNTSTNILFFLNWFNSWFHTDLHHKFVLMLHEVNRVIFIDNPSQTETSLW